MHRRLPARVRAFLSVFFFSCLLVLLSGSATAANDALKNSASSFLRSHASNPVQWLPWGPEAAQRAQAEKKPIYLAIGFTTNELSQAMNRQTFSNAEVAAKVNAEFVCVLVDRDEHPGLAALYQNFVSNKKQLTGWPLNVWLTPDLKPIDGATYLPPSEEWGKEGFLNAVQRVAAAWKTDASAQQQKAEDAVAEIAALSELPAAADFPASEIEAKLAAHEKLWLEQLDPAHGGFGEPPKYLQPELLQFLAHGSPAAREAAALTLRSVHASAMRDALDGGFFRYATDPAWQLPYFQKLATDQARAAQAYLNSGDASSVPAWRRASARKALDFLLHALRGRDGGFLNAVDATAEENRIHHAWTREQIDQVLGASTGSDFARDFSIATDGNVAESDDAGGKFKGRNLLRLSAAAAEDRDGLDSKWDTALGKLLAAREKRMAPRIDDNVVAANQGHVLFALARAHAAFPDAGYLEAALACAASVESTLLDSKTGQLRRLAGSPAPASAADYASLARGYAALHQVSKKESHREIAQALLEVLAGQFLDSSTGRLHATPADTLGLWHRVYSPLSGSGDLPSAEATALLALKELGTAKPARLEALQSALIKGLRIELDEANGPAGGASLLAARSALEAK